MAFKVKCTRCGKAAPARKVDGGFQAYCRGCGLNFFVPANMAVEFAEEKKGPAAGGAAATAQQQGVSGYELQLADARRRHTMRQVKAGIIALSCIFLFALGYFGYHSFLDSRKASRVQAGRDAVASLTSEGRKLADE